MSTPDVGLANWFLQRSLRTPERVALALDGQTWSYAQMQQHIEQLAARLCISHRRLNVLTLVPLQKGGLVLLHRNFDAAVALAEVQRHRVTTMFGVPTMFQFMAQHPNFADTDLSGLRILICGAAPCPESLLKTWETRGVPILTW